MLAVSHTAFIIGSSEAGRARTDDDRIMSSGL